MPAGVSTPSFGASIFSPSNLSNLYLWLRADKGITLSGSQVTAWADQSGSNNMTGGGGTAGINNPTIVSAGLGPDPNKNASVLFTASPNIQYLFNLAGVQYAQPISIICAFASIGAAASSHTLYSGQTGAGSSCDLIEGDSGLNSIYVYAGIEPQITSLPFSINSFNVIQVDFNGSNTNIYQNGYFVTTVNASTLPAQPYLVGILDGAGTSYNGYISELVGFKSILSPIQRNSVNQYLQNRYNIIMNA